MADWIQDYYDLVLERHMASAESWRGSYDEYKTREEPDDPYALGPFKEEPYWLYPEHQPHFAQRLMQLFCRVFGVKWK